MFVEGVTNLEDGTPHLVTLMLSTQVRHFVRIEPLKVRHDITKLDLTIPLLSLLCIDIELII